jgi:hypothetical protein
MRKSKNLQGRQPVTFETTDVDKTASNEWLKSGEIFPKTTGIMIAIQDQVISTSNYKKRILKDANTTNDFSSMAQQPLEG